MQRRSWFEIHDHPLFPRRLRDLTTDALEAIWNTQTTYAPILPRLEAAMRASGSRKIVDLCSGGGGPWLSLSCLLGIQGGQRPQICLTDLYPNRMAFERLNRESGLDYRMDPVDAMSIPRSLDGFRTIFSSFHHFSPEEARAILRDAFDAQQGVGIFESVTREPRTLLGVCLVPIFALLLTPRIRPFRWTRLIFTYLVPIIPFVLWVDGLLSCLRSYSESDFRELVTGLEDAGYRWDIGIDRSRLIPIHYLIGYPLCRKPSEREAAALATAAE